MARIRQCFGLVASFSISSGEKLGGGAEGGKGTTGLPLPPEGPDVTTSNLMNWM